jgi:hypothetical protein
MKTDKHITLVKFLFHEAGAIDDSNEILAFFPDDKYNESNTAAKDPYFWCYTRETQHSACHINYANKCRPATPAEYKELKAELESIGYNLQIVK